MALKELQLNELAVLNWLVWAAPGHVKRELFDERKDATVFLSHTWSAGYSVSWRPLSIGISRLNSETGEVRKAQDWTSDQSQ